MRRPPASPAAEGAGASRLFVGVGVGVYDDAEAFPPLGAAAEVGDLAAVMETFGYRALPSPPHPRYEEASGLLNTLAEAALSTESCLVVLWAGHGEPVERGLHLVSRDSSPGQFRKVTSADVVEAAVRSGASQILLLFDTCHAGTGALEALSLAHRIEESLPLHGAQRWIGILPAALAYETARDGLFGAELLRLLQDGPTDPELRLRWSAHNAGIRGDDVIDCLVKQWRSRDQTLVPLMRGNAGVMLPNPRYDPLARDTVVEQLLLAARGINVDEEGDFFTGRVAPLADLVGWIGRGRAGVALVSGPAGCGKSALLGRIAALSDPRDRARILTQGALPHADPGEGCVAAAVAVRGATVDDLVRRLEAELVRGGLLRESPPEEPRNRMELLGAVERLARRGPPPLLLIDGLEEAGGELTRIVDELLRPLAGVARLLISSRPIPPPQPGEPPLLDTLQAGSLVDLGALEATAQTRHDLAAYVSRRLAGVFDAMDPDAVAAEILRLVRRQEEGGFLLARLITARLRQQPVDTAAPDWQRQLAGSVAEALDQELEALPPLVRGEERLPQAARELLGALAWALGQGFPVEEWALAATALSPSRTVYGREEVFWLLGVASRWVVESGERGQAVYRLSHQRLAEHLRPPAWASPWKPVGAPEAVALAEAFGQAALAWSRSGRPPEEQPYLWTHLLAHAVDGGAAGIGCLRELSERNPAFLPDLALALNNLGIRYSNLGRREEALKPTEEAVRICGELSEGNPAFLTDLALALNNLGVRYSELGRREEALKPTEEAVAIYRELSESNPAYFPSLALALNNLGIWYSNLGRLEEALNTTEEAVKIYGELSESNPAFLPDLASALTNQGTRYSNVGHREEALKPTEESVRIFREFSKSNPAFLPDLALALNNLGVRYSELGCQEEALKPTEEAVCILRELSESNPTFLPNLAAALNNLGTRYSELGRPEESLKPTEESVEIYGKLSEGNQAFLPDLACALINLGVSYRELGLREEALKPTEEAVRIRGELAENNPSFFPDLANALDSLGVTYSNLGRRQEALKPTEEAVRIFREFSQSNRAFLPNLARSLSNLGTHYSNLGRRQEAIKPAEEAVRIFRELSESNPVFLPDLASSLNCLGAHYSNLGRGEEALKPTEEAVRIRRKLSEKNLVFLLNLARELDTLGVIYSDLGRREEALKPSEEAAEIFLELSGRNPALLLDLARSLTNLGTHYGNLGRREEALKRMEGAVRIFNELSESNPAFLPDLATSLGAFGSAQREAGDGQAACESFRKALACLLAVLKVYPAAVLPLAQNLARDYFAMLHQLGRQPDPDLMAAYAAVFDEDQSR